MRQLTEDLHFPVGTTDGVELAVDGGFLDNLEGEGAEGGGIGGRVVDEEDGAHAALTEDFESFELVKVKLRRRWSC